MKLKLRLFRKKVTKADAIQFQSIATMFSDFLNLANLRILDKQTVAHQLEHFLEKWEST